MVDEKYKFTEKERDNETNYDYFGARYYNSKIGLWNSADPLADKYPGISPYSYCTGNPLLFVDTKGKDIILYYRRASTDFPHYDAGHIFLRVVDHLTGKELSSWSFGPKEINANLLISSVKSHQDTEAEIMEIINGRDGIVDKVTFLTEPDIDKKVAHNIEERKKTNELYNLYNNNCATTALELINSSKEINITAHSIKELGNWPNAIYQQAKSSNYLFEKKKKYEQIKLMNEFIDKMKINYSSNAPGFFGNYAF